MDPNTSVLHFSSHNKIQLTETFTWATSGLTTLLLKPLPCRTSLPRGHWSRSSTAELGMDPPRTRTPSHLEHRPVHLQEKRRPRALRQHRFQCVTVKVYSEPSVLVWAAGPVLRGNAVNIADSWIQFIRHSAETIIREGDK